MVSVLQQCMGKRSSSIDYTGTCQGYYVLKFPTSPYQGMGGSPSLGGHSVTERVTTPPVRIVTPKQSAGAVLRISSKSEDQYALQY